MHVSNSKKPALIAIGYVLSVVVGFVAAAVNEALMPDDVAQGSPGMVAFGDMILFIFVTGVFSLPPTWFLLQLLVATAPRTLLTGELFVARPRRSEILFLPLFGHCLDRRPSSPELR